MITSIIYINLYVRIQMKYTYTMGIIVDETIIENSFNL